MQTRAVIHVNFPKASIPRRNTGYALDLLMDARVFDPTSDKPFNLCRLIAGSEGSGPLILLSEANSADGKHAELARIELEGRSANLLLLVCPATDSARLEVFALPDSRSGQAEAFRAINLSDVQVGVMLGRHKAVIMPYSEQGLRVENEVSRMMPLQLATRAPDESWQVAYSSTIPLRSGRNLLCLILPGQDGIRPPILVSEFTPTVTTEQSDENPGGVAAPRE